VPGGLTLSQRLTNRDGLPTAVARAGAVALVCAGAALGYAAGPDGGEQPTDRTRGGAVAISRVSGELPIATPEPRPSLTAAAALPAFREGAPLPSRERQASRAATPAPQPAPAATPEPAAPPEPAATPEPVSTTAPPVDAAPAPAPAPKAPPAPRSTPAPTFDSEG
jgi:hypothetical protein